MDVKVYSTPSCPWCTKVKEYLDGLGISYTPVDVAASRETAMELVKKTKQMGVPVTQIGEKYIVGYNPTEIESSLKAAGLLK